LLQRLLRLLGWRLEVRATPLDYRASFSSLWALLRCSMPFGAVCAPGLGSPSRWCFPDRDRGQHRGNDPDYVPSPCLAITGPFSVRPGGALRWLHRQRRPATNFGLALGLPQKRSLYPFVLGFVVGGTGLLISLRQPTRRARLPRWATRLRKTSLTNRRANQWRASPIQRASEKAQSMSGLAA